MSQVCDSGDKNELIFYYLVIVNFCNIFPFVLQKETIERQKHEMCIRVNLREKRLQSARIRKYYDEYQVRQRSKMLKKKTKEELVK